MRNLLHNADGKKTVLLGALLVIGALLAAVYLYFNVVVFERAPREQAAHSGQPMRLIDAGQISGQDMPHVNGLATGESNVTTPTGHVEPNLPRTEEKDNNSKQKSANIKPSNPKDSRR